MIRRISQLAGAALPAGSMRRRLAVGTFWNLTGTVVSRVLMLAAAVATARLLRREGFGELNMVRSTVGMLGVFAGLGLGLTATKHVAEHRERAPARAGRVLALCVVFATVAGAVMSAALLVFAPVLAASVLDAPHLSPILRLASGLLLLSAVNGTLRGALGGLEAFRSIALADGIRALFGLPLMVAGVIWAELMGVVLALVTIEAIGSAVLWRAVRRRSTEAGVGLRFGRFSEELPVLWKFALPSMLGGAMVSPAMWAARAILVRTPGGYGELGMFGAASQFRNLLATAAATFSTVLLPMLASQVHSPHERFRKANVLLSWAIGVYPALLLVSFPELVSLVFGPDYTGIAFQRTVVVVSLFTCIILYKQGIARALAARDMMWWGFAENAVWGVMLLVFAYLFRGHGALGLAGAFLLAYVIISAAFVPLYVVRDLVPRVTILSFPVALAWVGLLAPAWAGFAACSLPARGGLCVVGLAMVTAAFLMMFGVREVRRMAMGILNQVRSARIPAGGSTTS